MGRRDTALDCRLAGGINARMDLLSRLFARSSLISGCLPAFGDLRSNLVFLAAASEIARKDASGSPLPASRNSSTSDREFPASLICEAQNRAWRSYATAREIQIYTAERSGYRVTGYRAVPAA